MRPIPHEPLSANDYALSANFNPIKVRPKPGERIQKHRNNLSADIDIKVMQLDMRLYDRFMEMFKAMLDTLESEAAALPPHDPNLLMEYVRDGGSLPQWLVRREKRSE